MIMATGPEGALRVAEGQPAVHFERTYAAGIKELWAAISEPAHLVQWFREVTGDLVEGASYGIVSDSGVASKGRIERCEPGRHLELNWVFPGEAPSHVAVSSVSASTWRVRAPTRTGRAGWRSWSRSTSPGSTR